MQIKLTHVRLLVEDFGACFRFYRDVLGFTPSWGDEETGYADFETGTAILALFGRQAMANAVGKSELPFDAVAQDRVALTFKVPSVDEAAAELTGRGVALETEPADRTDWGIRAAHFRDPDGNLIEINQPLQKN